MGMFLHLSLFFWFSHPARFSHNCLGRKDLVLRVPLAPARWKTKERHIPVQKKYIQIAPYFPADAVGRWKTKERHIPVQKVSIQTAVERHRDAEHRGRRRGGVVE